MLKVCVLCFGCADCYQPIFCGIGFWEKCKKWASKKSGFLEHVQKVPKKTQAVTGWKFHNSKSKQTFPVLWQAIFGPYLFCRFAEMPIFLAFSWLFVFRDKGKWSRGVGRSDKNHLFCFLFLWAGFFARHKKSPFSCNFRGSWLLFTKSLLPSLALFSHQNGLFFQLFSRLSKVSVSGVVRFGLFQV